MKKNWTKINISGGLQLWISSSLVALHVSQQCALIKQQRLQQRSHRVFVTVSVMKTPLTARQCPSDREQDVPHRPAPSFLLPREQTRSPGSINVVPEPTSPILWLWFCPTCHRGTQWKRNVRLSLVSPGETVLALHNPV